MKVTRFIRQIGVKPGERFTDFFGISAVFVTGKTFIPGQSMESTSPSWWILITTPCQRYLTASSPRTSSPQSFPRYSISSKTSSISQPRMNMFLRSSSNPPSVDSSPTFPSHGEKRRAQSYPRLLVSAKLQFFLNETTGDFDRILRAFASLNNTYHQTMLSSDWLLVLFNILCFIQGGGELATRKKRRDLLAKRKDRWDGDTSRRQGK